MASGYPLPQLRGRSLKATQEQNRVPATSPVPDLLAGREVLERAVHELQNHLQTIGMGLDLLRLTQVDSLEGKTMVQRIEQASRLLREVREYFCPPELCLSVHSLAAVVREVAEQQQEDWRRQGVRLRVVCRDPLPALRLDWRQVRNALERVLAFARALLPQGGELEIAARLRERGGQRYIEFKVSSFAATALEVEETDIFQPFLQVSTYQTGLSLVLVRQMVSRQHGQISFRKTSPRQGCFTLLLTAHSEQ